MKTVPGTSIRNLQQMLRTVAAADERLTSVVPDGIYGADTAAAVKRFQEVSGLPVTGSTDLATWNALVSVYDAQSPYVLPPAPLLLRWQAGTQIMPGAANSHLYLIQSMLAAIGTVFTNTPPVSVTGVHDAASVTATKWLQEKAGLPQTGCICQKTWRHLCALYCLCCGDGTEKILVPEHET